MVQLVYVLSQLANELTQLVNKWAQSTKGVQGEQGGINIANVRRLWMWNNRKMKSLVFIHNDDTKCFHVVVQGTHKLVVMGHINFEDHALIKRQWIGKKMNATSTKFKDKKKN